MKKIKVMGLLNLPAHGDKLHELLASDEIEIVGCAYNTHQAVTVFDKKKPNIVIMDIDWPTMPGMLSEMFIYFLDVNRFVKLVGISEKFSYDNMEIVRKAYGKGIICYDVREVENPVERLKKVINGGWALSQKL